MNRIKGKKIGVYIRESKYNSKIKKWETEIKDICNYYEAKIYDIYADVGVSGTTIERTELKRMLEDSRLKKFDIVLTPNLQMLCRTLEVYREIKQTLNENDIDVFEISNSKPVHVPNWELTFLEKMTETIKTQEEKFKEEIRD